MEKLNKKVLKRIGKIKEQINARSKGVRLLLEKAGINVPESTPIKLYHIHLASKQSSEFMPNLLALLEAENANAEGTTTWTDIASAVSSGLAVVFSSLGSSSETATDDAVLQAAAAQVKAEQEKSNTMKWVAIGASVVVVLVIVIVIIKMRR